MKAIRIRCWVLLLPLVVLINGCAGMNSQFDCPMKPGVRCESLDQVNEAVNRGEIGHAPTNTAASTTAIHSIPSVDASPLPGEPLRYGETVQRIWIAPFEDTGGNYHQESEIYTIAKGGHWIGSPVKDMNDGEE